MKKNTFRVILFPFVNTFCPAWGFSTPYAAHSTVNCSLLSSLDVSTQHFSKCGHALDAHLRPLEDHFSGMVSQNSRLCSSQSSTTGTCPLVLDQPGRQLFSSSSCLTARCGWELPGRCFFPDFLEELSYFPEQDQCKK